MPYKSTQDCVLDLERQGQLLRIKGEVDPNLEMAEIHRRVYRASGPAILYENVKGSPFPAVSNLFGTLERARYIFRRTINRVQDLVELKADPSLWAKAPAKLFGAPWTALTSLPLKVKNGPVLECKTAIDQLPQIKCWPGDGGPFVLMGQVYTENVEKPGILKSNMGMYRIQMSGNEYEINKTVGLHYQIRRDIGIHHEAALRRGERFRVSIFVGGPPAHAFAAVMYLPEDVPEIAFAGALAGRNFRYAVRDGFVISTDADFCITGFVEPDRTKPEGPFGDHLGYYSLKHEFPYLNVETVYHRKDAIWPFTVVGRPPQEDTSFGKLVQEIAGPMLPREIPGVKAVHAVDAAGIHPLLLAIGSERYAPYEYRKPQEILTLANALLGYGPLALAKYLMIVAGEDNPDLDIHDIKAFFMHLLERINWETDLHFQTSTTMDTLDYSAGRVNTGSKVVMAAAGKPIRSLARALPEPLKLPRGFTEPRLALPGVMVVGSDAFRDYRSAEKEIDKFMKSLRHEEFSGVPLIVMADDSVFAAGSEENFLWTTFTRSNPSHDIYGVESFTDHKHWGCYGSLVIDARAKPHHAPPLEEDLEITKRVDALAEQGRPLHGVI